MTIRERNLALLNALGFRVAGSLPTVRLDGPTTLRPVGEIAARLAALAALFQWAAEVAADVPSADLRDYINANDLRHALTAEEAAILDLDRDAAIDGHSYNIGWRLENMWSLAWILGFEPQPALSGMIDGDIIERMHVEFVRCPSDSVSGFLKRIAVRPVHVVDEVEDLFYCAHNAVRSAQLGGATVPDGFHPVIDGGGIHERRHGLTWALSPGTGWDDTDLST
jgi:hypothetical protein